jgi:hypothetical protein
MPILKHGNSEVQSVSTSVQDSLLPAAQARNSFMATISGSCDGNCGKREGGKKIGEMHGELVVQLADLKQINVSMV